MAKRSTKPLALLRGMKDILPEDTAVWRTLRRHIEDLALNYGFEELVTPVVEQKALFVRSIGEETDIVSKEMFTFVDHGDSVVLRPEFTAGMARAYIEHGMVNRPQPIKVFTMGPVFRRERPQAGRQRQFHQIDFEVFGDASPAMDAMLMVLCFGLCQEMDVPVTLQVNSIGNAATRKEYIKALMHFLKPNKRALCEDCQKRLTKNALRVLDCKNKKCQVLLEEAPEIVDYLDEASKQHFVGVLEYLDVAEVPYTLNSKLVRGLDYYNRTVFEFWPTDAEGAQSTLIGGGRYDGLLAKLGGRDISASGFAIGVERFLTRARQSQRVEWKTWKPEIFLAQLGDRAKRKALYLLERLRRSGFKVAHDFSNNGLRDQLGLASKLGVAYTLVLGQKEIMDDTVMVRDMENGSQEIVDMTKIIPDLQKRFQKS